MRRKTMRWRTGSGATLLGLFGLLTACGSGGDGPRAEGRLTGTSFSGFVVQPGPGTTIPSVFRDQALEFRFDGPIEAAFLGGLARDGNGDAIVLEGVAPVAGNPSLPYRPFADQAAARAAFQIRENATGALLVGYLLGVHRERPRILVVDPVVDLERAELLSVAPGYGFRAATSYTFRIPPRSRLTIGRRTAQAVGVDPGRLPLVPGQISAPLGAQLLFRAAATLTPTTAPPRLLAIEPSSEAAGTTVDPLAPTDALRIRFDQPIDPSSIDALDNLRVRDLERQGALLPGRLEVRPEQPDVVLFTPNPSYGPGTAGNGPRVEVAVGTRFGPPEARPIRGLPRGLQGSVEALDPSSARREVFEVLACPSCATPVLTGFRFADTTRRDPNHEAPLATAAWDDDDSGRLEGVRIAGDPLAGFRGEGTLGSRWQVTVLGPSQLSPPPPTGLVSPFDAPGNTFPSNPGAGARFMQLFSAAELGNPSASLELVEWGPATPMNTQVAGPVTPTTFPMYQAWAGETSITAPQSCPTGVNGLSPLFVVNYDRTQLQPVDPNNANPNGPANAGGVQLTDGPMPYVTESALTTYFPFPLFTTPFDYRGGAASAPSLILEMNIESGAQLPNFTRYRAGAFTPVRQQVGLPRSLGSTTSTGLNGSLAVGCLTNDYRFTFVDLVSSARSTFLDAGDPASAPGAFPQPVGFRDIRIRPAPWEQPAGTESSWAFEGATGLLSPTVATGPTSGFLTWFSGPPRDGQGNARLPARDILGDPNAPGDPNRLGGYRYLRFRVDMRNDAGGNARPSYESLGLHAVRDD